ncbi:MAG: polysaccharide biosynthesis protein [Heliobacteriaceae bacterium]|nr:polysaccharide biosynthesis protein [Heliobacteriaceae bacterium]
MRGWWGAGGQRFLTGEFWLTGAGIVSKFLGAFYRISLARILGPEGVGLYQMAYPLYTVILSLATAGLPVAISVLVARKVALGDHNGAHRVFGAAFGLTLVLGSGATCLLLVFAGDLATNLLKDPRVVYSLWAIAPAILLASLMAAWRGYFQGYRQMVPTALSQVVEQMVRVVTILVLSLVLLGYGLEMAAAGAAFGAVTGGLAGLAVLGGFYRHWRGHFFGPGAASGYPVELAATTVGRAGSWADRVGLWKALLALSLPISLGGIVMPLLQTVDALLIPRGLQLAGYTASQAAALFGEFSGMAATLVYLPTVVTAAVGASLVPAISGAWSAGNAPLARGRYLIALRLVALLAWPAAAGLAVLAAPICELLFKAPGAALPLIWLAPAVVLTGFYQVATASLQGTGRTAFPVVALGVGVVIKAGCNVFLLPGLGLFGAALGTNLAFLVAACLTVSYFTRHSRVGVPWQAVLLKPLIAVTIMAGYLVQTTPFLLGWLGPWPGLGVAILSGGMVYGLSILAIGGVKAGDVAVVPRIGPTLARWYRQVWGE